MPTRPFTIRELTDSELLAQLAMLVDDDASDDEELVDELLIACCDPLIRERKEEIGPERLSLQRLHRDAAAAGLASETMSANIYCDYRFRLEDLPAVVQALDPPAGFRTHSGAVFTGEEGVLLLLRRFRSTNPLLDLTKETGRTTSRAPAELERSKMSLFARRCLKEAMTKLQLLFTPLVLESFASFCVCLDLG